MKPLSIEDITKIKDLIKQYGIDTDNLTRYELEITQLSHQLSKNTLSADLQEILKRDKKTCQNIKAKNNAWKLILEKLDS